MCVGAQQQAIAPARVIFKDGANVSTPDPNNKI